MGTRPYKLGDRALVVLRCIDARTERDATGKLLRFWVPSLDTRAGSDFIDEDFQAIGGADGHIIRALIRHGLCEKPSGSWAYCAASTEDGRLAIERAREAGRWGQK